MLYWVAVVKTGFLFANVLYKGSADWSQAIYVLWMWLTDKKNNWGWLEISQYVPRLGQTKHLFSL